MVGWIAAVYRGSGLPSEVGENRHDHCRPCFAALRGIPRSARLLIDTNAWMDDEDFSGAGTARSPSRSSPF